MYVYIYMCVYIYMYMYIYICIYTYIYIHIYITQAYLPACLHLARRRLVCVRQITVRFSRLRG